MNRRHWLKYLSLSSVGGLLPLTFLPRKQESDLLVPNTECLTTDDILGPFYIPNTVQSTQISPADAPGTTLLITGTIYARDCQTPLPNAKVEVWQASDDGDYFDDSYRATLFSDDTGSYAFSTVLPGKYLNGNQFRPRHLHYKVSSGNVELITQIYFSGDTSIPNDPWASDPDAADRIIDLSTDDNQNLHGVADVYLDVEPTSSQEPRSEDYRRLAFIQSIHPQPIGLDSEGQLIFVLARAAEVEILCYNLAGQQVQTAVTRQYFQDGQHIVGFSPLNNLGLKMPTGIYVLRLLVNQKAVDAKRIVVA